MHENRGGNCNPNPRVVKSEREAKEEARMENKQAKETARPTALHFYPFNLCLNIGVLWL
jgi:hypothetical protein